ncbi:radical SAM/SPASM domain-containing protein [Alkaliphilus hydrothermalis]|uniref:Radical SAM protein with 4Fe4S-binding SPASM domain n=1 Tax=Alkaliphilus hydrothermalis TaxID=1482730 RepID=A0ABS2NRK5_9FIRM|nr:radical SAM protein [Alkaliphilus hydrothermalis]MBM7615507.1 radical SAM protein with 4Fe4S-binding SPASM domain [Alkaliphilus hydrothermalis]
MNTITEDGFIEKYILLRAGIKVKKRTDHKLLMLKKDCETFIVKKPFSSILEALASGQCLRDIFEKKTIRKEGQLSIISMIKDLIEKEYLILSDELIPTELDLEPQWTLDEVFLELTKKCNLKCHHCYISPDIQDHELSFEKWKEIIEECSQLGVYLVKVTGGEALLSPYFFQLIELIKNEGMLVRLYTNGTGLSKEVLSKLKNSGVTELQISLDGATEDTHDNFRRTKGNFEKINNTLPLLEEMGFSVILSFTVSNYNKSEINDFIKLARQFSNISIVVSPYINYHQTFNDTNKMLDVGDDLIQELKVTFNNNSDIWTKKTIYYSTYSNNYIGYCGFGIYSCYIDSFGKVLFCPLINQEDQILGNVLKDSLKDIWRDSPLLRNYRKNSVMDIEGCSSCLKATMCRGGCRARAFFKNGTFLSKDEISCKFF